MLIFLKILLILLCILIGFILVILFTPIYISFSSNEKKAENTSILIHFFHPAFIRISYIFCSNKYEIVILNIVAFGTLKEKPKPDLTKKITRPELEQSISEPEISKAEHSFEENMSEKRESENDKKRQSDLDTEDKNGKDNYKGIENYTPNPSSPESNKSFDIETKDTDLFKEQEDIDIKKDIKSSGDKALRSAFFKNFKNKILAFKDFSQFVLDQKKIAKKVILWLKRIIIRIVRIISFDDFSLYLKAGFDDPFLTGIVYGYFTGIEKIFGLSKHSSDGFQFEPVFNKNDVVTIVGSIRIKTSLARMGWPLFVAIFTFPYFSAFILWRRIKKRKKVI